jgi:hypothetical protein
VRHFLPPPVVLVLVLATPLLTGVPAASGAVAAPDPAVRKAQRILNDLRCDAGREDGRIDTHTRSALIRFQSRHRLAQTGRLDARTRSRLRSERAQRCDRRPVPARTGSGRRIVVSQHQNWIWLVGAAGKVQAQGGIVDNPGVLRKGTWRTGSYCGRPARVQRNTSTGGGLWLDHFVRFAPCGIGFHRIPRRMSTGGQIHPDHYLGTNLAGASHGCVRLSRTMANRVWQFTAGRRTTVRVV